MQTSEKNIGYLTHRIKLLDNQLANQIAAGEVVERPSSVVKELMENSIDAGATKIEVEIERGGARLIRVVDDGRGIHQDDLTLSLTRHATSKINTTADLACIKSLGFRGEALASISAVSKLTLTSRTHTSELAWQAMAHGRDMQVVVQPAAASPGTRIDVADLFFNTPARQKFLRAEKTEFNHIEEVFKRHALANFDIEFILKHNQKIIKRVTACQNQSQQLNRIANICGKAFAENCVAFECQHESIQLYGWLGIPSFHRSESDIQYVFINGRPVKDKTLNHAIRQAYDGLLPIGRMATYVIFLSMDPAEVDVNVHPTKHEVRFGEQRLVHDLLAKSITESLIDCHSKLDTIHQNDFPIINKSQRSYSSSPKNTTHFVREQINHSPVFNQLESSPLLLNESIATYDLWLLDNNFALAKIKSVIYLIDGNQLLKEFLLKLLQQKGSSKTNLLQNKALLFPHQLAFNSEILEDHQFHLQLQSLGFVAEPISNDASNHNQLLIKKIPCWLSCFDNQWIFQQMSFWFNANELSNNFILNKIMLSFNEIPKALIRFLIDQIDDFTDIESVMQLDSHHFKKLFL